MAKRVLQGIPSVLAIVVFAFLLIHLQPGDPATMLAGEYANPGYVERVRHEFGLDKPLYEQLAIYISKILQGDFGNSYRYNTPVLPLILDRAPATILLMGVGTAFYVIVGIPLGVLSAKKLYSYTDNVVTFFSMFGLSSPPFWIAQLLVLFLALYLNLFPTSGMTTLTLVAGPLGRLIDVLWHLALPALSWALYNLALVTRLTRTNMLEALSADYIVLARSKGLSDRTVTYQHALKNASLPIITVIGINIGKMISGSVLIETVFGWPGIGRLTYEALLSLDYPVMMGVFIIVSITMVVTAITLDVLYAYLDPRIRYA